nr:alcohol dehydrogenase catalytic domain-containing protein [Allorhizocola rhizosphaerae]
MTFSGGYGDARSQLCTVRRAGGFARGDGHADAAAGAGQVRVRGAASVVHRVDLMIRAGRFPAPLPTELPYVPGWDVVGTVDAVGPSVGEVTVDDDVIGLSPWLRTAIGAHALST